VRYFVKQPFSDGAILSAVPDEQLGVILAYNFFNYKPFEVIQKYLEEMYQKLRPGGVVMMTINDCDRPGGVDLVDRYAAAYTPSSLVQGYAEKLGYQVFFRYDLDAAVTWLEFVRPGKLTSLRGGQTLAKTVV
jgi:SAM-dependent methyltransferase